MVSNGIFNEDFKETVRLLGGDPGSLADK